MRTRSTRGCARSRPNSTREICSTARRTSRRGEPERGVLGENVPAAGLAPFAVAHRALVVGADVVRAARDPHVLRIPQGEGVDRAGGPTPARAAMAITHAGRLARHGELDGAAEAAALIGLRIAHEDTSRIMTLMLAGVQSAHALLRASQISDWDRLAGASLRLPVHP